MKKLLVFLTLAALLAGCKEKTTVYRHGATAICYDASVYRAEMKDEGTNLKMRLVNQQDSTEWIFIGKRFYPELKELQDELTQNARDEDEIRGDILDFTGMDLIYYRESILEQVEAEFMEVDDIDPNHYEKGESGKYEGLRDGVQVYGYFIFALLEGGYEFILQGESTDEASRNRISELYPPSAFQ